MDENHSCFSGISEHCVEIILAIEILFLSSLRYRPMKVSTLVIFVTERQNWSSNHYCMTLETQDFSSDKNHDTQETVSLNEHQN